MNTRTKYSSGFTLIELVTVIVILGILATAAAPKFVDLTSDSRAAVVMSVAGAMKSAASMTYAKAIVRSQEKAPSSSINVGNLNIPIVYGYPTAAYSPYSDEVMSLLNVGTVGLYNGGVNGVNSQYDWVVQNHITNSVRNIVIAQGVITGDGNATMPINTKCYIRYIQATSSTPFKVETDTSGC